MSTKKQDDKKADDTRKEAQKTFDAQAEALSGRANMAAKGTQAETGPAQGHDVAVPLPDATADDQGIMVEQETTTGPAQEPVHRVAAPVAEEEAPAKPKRHAKLNDDQADEIVAIVKQAHETLGTATTTDAFGRSWMAQYGHVNNQAAITLQVGRGDDTHQTVLATSGMPSDDPDALRKAVKAASENVK